MNMIQSMIRLAPHSNPGGGDRVDLVVPARPEVGAGNNAWRGEAELLLHRDSLSQSLAAGVRGSDIRIQRLFGLTVLKAD